MSSTEKILKFSSAVRGFHYYQRLWFPREEETLNCYYEQDNAFDLFAIKTEQCDSGTTVGHLPREISRITKFILDRGARITATLTSTNYRRSPLVQGGLEIACEVTVRMPATIKNHMILDRYKELLNDYYIEPKDEEILGNFLALSTTNASPPEKETAPKRKKKKTTTNVNENIPDIRVMFRRQQKNHNKQNRDDAKAETVIVID